MVFSMNPTPRAVLIRQELEKLESLEPLVQIEEAINDLTRKLAPEMLGADGKITRAASKRIAMHRNILERLQMESVAEAENNWKTEWRTAERMAETNPSGALAEFCRLAKSLPAGMRLSGEIVRGATVARRLMDVVKRPGDKEE